MKFELEQNAHKGEWNEWNPSPKDISREIRHHLLKLEEAMFQSDVEKIKEYAADVANISEKAFNLAESL